MQKGKVENRDGEPKWDDLHPTYREDLGRRLLTALEKFSTKKEAADAAGIGTEQLNKWLGNVREGVEIPKVPVEALLAIAEAAGVDFNWLATGQNAPHPEAFKLDGVKSEYQAKMLRVRAEATRRIPRYSAQLSAGSGTFFERAEILNYIPFNPDFFLGHLNRNPEDMIIVDARGESMEPTMRDRDLLMIDRSSAKRPITSAIYGFTFGQDIYVKRLFVTPDGIVAKSDNKDYGEFTIKPEDMDQFHPIGRVVWIGRTL